MMEDYSKYLSYDNGKGILLNKYDKEVLDRYQINYQECSSIKSLIILRKCFRALRRKLLLQ